MRSNFRETEGCRISLVCAGAHKLKGEERGLGRESSAGVEEQETGALRRPAEGCVFGWFWNEDSGIVRAKKREGGQM